MSEIRVLSSSPGQRRHVTRDGNNECRSHSLESRVRSSTGLNHGSWPLNGTKSDKREVNSTFTAAGQPQRLQFQRQCRQGIQRHNKLTNDEIDKRAKNHVTYAQPEIVQGSENPEYGESAANNAAASEPQSPGKLKILNV